MGDAPEPDPASGPAARPVSAAPAAPTAPAATSCANHPARPAVGRCPACRQLVCDECHVRLDGILHCKRCLQAQARKLESRRAPGLAARAGTCAVAAVALLAAFLAAEGVLGIAGFVGGRMTRWFAVNVDAADEDAR